MNKTELLNRLASDASERLLLSRVLDKLEAARQRNVPAHTPFLSPGERAAVEELIAQSGHPRHLFFGGYEGSERTVCAFLPDWMEEEDWLSGEDCPVCALRCTFREEESLSHRDFLGSLMGQGITREKLGDILVGTGKCDILLLRELEPYLLQNLISAGRARLKVSPLSLSQVEPPQVKKELIRDTVAALRLDAVAAAAFHLSRGKAADLISSGRLTLNYKECLKADRTVAAGDVLACRGLGKCVVKEVPGLSKKGRIMIVLERYV